MAVDCQVIAVDLQVIAVDCQVIAVDLQVIAIDCQMTVNDFPTSKMQGGNRTIALFRVIHKQSKKVAFHTRRVYTYTFVIHI